MSAGGNSYDNSRDSRPALSDITNQHGKRGFSLVWDNSLVKGVNQFGKKYNEEKVEYPSCKRPYTIGGGTPTSILIANGRAKSLLKGTPAIYPTSPSPGASSSKEIVSIAQLCDTIKGSSLSNISLSLGTGTTSVDMGDRMKEGNDAPIDGFSTINRVNRNHEPIQDDDVHGTQVTEPLIVGGVGVSKECSRLAQPHSSNFRMGKCKNVKVDGCSSSNSAVGLIENCSCSFCLKAAFIWSDLHYQDIRGRITAVRRSQKDAGLLAEKCSIQTDHKPCDGNLGSSRETPELDSDLTDQWSSFFRRMEDIYRHETDKLLSEYVAIRELKDNCKSELESINKKPSGS